MKKELDLFEHIETLPKEVQDVIKHYSQFNGLDYNQCAEFQFKLNQLGFTFDYYLDAEPYGLRVLSFEEKLRKDIEETRIMRLDTSHNTYLTDSKKREILDWYMSLSEEKQIWIQTIINEAILEQL